MPTPCRADPACLDPLPVSCEALPALPLPVYQYPSGPWYYQPPQYCDHRYLLGRPGVRTLVCIGINPSTAVPGALDPTLQSVERLARANGFDGWVMCNVYPQRATDPGAMHRDFCRDWHERNLQWLRLALAQGQPTLWAAWGTLIEKRPYLPELLRDMVRAAGPAVPWVCFGRLSKAGHPHHPLYLRRDAAPQPFDVQGYLRTLEGP